MSDPSERKDGERLLGKMQEQFIGGDATSAAISDMMNLFAFSSVVQLMLLATFDVPAEKRTAVIEHTISMWKRALLSQNTKFAQEYHELLSSVTDRDHLTWALPDSESARVGFMRAVKAAEKRIRETFTYAIEQERQLRGNQG